MISMKNKYNGRYDVNTPWERARKRKVAYPEGRRKFQMVSGKSKIRQYTVHLHRKCEPKENAYE